MLSKNHGAGASLLADSLYIHICTHYCRSCFVAHVKYLYSLAWITFEGLWNLFIDWWRKSASVLWYCSLRCCIHAEFLNNIHFNSASTVIGFVFVCSASAVKVWNYSCVVREFRTYNCYSVASYFALLEMIFRKNFMEMFAVLCSTLFGFSQFFLQAQVRQRKALIISLPCHRPLIAIDFYSYFPIDIVTISMSS